MDNNFRIILAKERKTIADVYKATGISKSTLINFYYERTENPELKTMIKIADCLKVSIDELVGRKEEIEG